MQGSREKKESGFSLTELVVAIAIGMVILAAVTATFIAQSKSFDAQEQINQMQQNARGAMDIIVREVTPAHARGKVYGFVYSGIDLGSSVAPPLVGWLLDTGKPRLVFLASAAALLMCAVIMLLLGRGRG